MTATSVFQSAQIVVERGHLGVVGAKDSLQDFKRTTIEPPGLSKLARVFVEDAEIVEDAGHFQRVRTKGGFRQRQRLTVEWLRLAIIAFRAADLGGVAQ